MANSFKYEEKNVGIGDTIKLGYKIKEGKDKAGKDKVRIQDFQGILVKITGGENNKTITVRKMTRSGIGVERIIPLVSPHLASLKVVKKGNVRRSKIYFIRGLSDQNLRASLYQKK